MATKKSEEEIEKEAGAKKEKLDPKVRKQSPRPTFEWGLNHMKLQAATTYVDQQFSGLGAQERHDKIKERYVEIKGRLPEQKRHKNGQEETGTPRPTSEQAIRYDEGVDPAAKEVEEDDDEDVDGTFEGELDR